MIQQYTHDFLLSFLPYLSRNRVWCMCIWMFLFLFHSLPSNAAMQTQVNAGQQGDSVVVLPETFRDKIGIRTNVVDWVATIPNISFEYEALRSRYYKNPYTIGATIRWNWNTWSKYNPSMVFNLFDVRIEGRKYWNTQKDRTNIKQLKDGRYELSSQKYKNGGMMTVTDTVPYWKYLYRQIGKIDRADAREERGYYFGFYLGYHNYSYKFGSTGRQGNAISGGITGGYTIPLYSYKGKKRDSYIDLDLGGSLGIFYTNFDEYGYDAESNCYPVTAANKSAIFPFVTELRLALVYRFKSVRQKMPLTDKGARTSRIGYLNERILERGRYRDSIATAKQTIRDSIATAKQLRRDTLEMLKRDKFLADSLANVQKQFRKDSIKLARQQEKALADSLKLMRKRMASEGIDIDSVGIDTISDVNQAIRRAADALRNIGMEVDVVPDNRTGETPLDGAIPTEGEDKQPAGKPEEEESEEGEIFIEF